MPADVSMTPTELTLEREYKRRRDVKAGDEMHAPEPDRETEIRDQAEFDKAVNRDGKIVLEWLAGFAVIAALLMSIVAISQSSQHNTVTVTSGAAPPATSSTAGASPAKLPIKTVSLEVIPAGKLGP